MLGAGQSRRWKRSGVTDLLALLALTAVPLVLGAAASGLLSTRDRAAALKAETPVAASLATGAEVALEGSIMLTESPVADEFVSQSVKSSKQRYLRSKPATESIASGGLGLTKAKQTSIFTLFSSEDPDTFRLGLSGHARG